ncbi:MAG: ABC transporter permease [Acidimicrobiales bacterium]|nr:ABC transporter permease [Acidimicrobiales bacterium]
MTRLVLGRLVRSIRFRLGAVLLVLLAVLMIVPGAVVALSPYEGPASRCSVRADDGSYQDLLSPSSDHWFGTDAQGCDVFAQVVLGARPSMSIGLVGGLLIAVVGTALGLLAATRGGWVDAFVRRVGDVTLGIPLVVGAILLLSVLAGDQRSWWEIAAVLAVLGWPATARIARTSARAVLTKEYVEAGRAAGATTSHLVRRHVLPNALPPVLAFSTLAAGVLIGAEATLTYLGIGLQIPTVSWGLMIEEGQRSYGRTPHLLIFPTVFLTLAVAAFVLLGDALRDALDAHVDMSSRTR